MKKGIYSAVVSGPKWGIFSYNGGITSNPQEIKIATGRRLKVRKMAHKARRNMGNEICARPKTGINF